MSESDPRDGAEPDLGGDRIDLSETVEHSAELITYSPEADYEQPPMMAMDYDPPEE